jgi:hypothetical protein
MLKRGDKILAEYGALIAPVWGEIVKMNHDKSATVMYDDGAVMTYEEGTIRTDWFDSCTTGVGIYLYDL